MAAAGNRPMTPLEWGLLVSLSVLWGGSFFFVGVAVAELPPLTIVALRVAIAALALWAVARATATPLPAMGKPWAAFLAMGLLNNVIPFTLIVWSQTHLASGVAAILNATTPFFTVLLAHGLTRDEKLSAGRLIGVAVGFGGVAALFGGGAVAALGTAELAQAAVLAAAVSYAFAGIYGRRFRAMGFAPLATAAGQVTASSLVLLPLALVVDRPWTLPPPEPATVAAVLGLALLSTALAYVLYFRILATAGATNLLLVTFLIPASAIALGVALLGEVLLPRHLVGMALIGLGLAAIDGRPWRWLGRLARPAREPSDGDGA